jgi:transposase
VERAVSAGAAIAELRRNRTGRFASGARKGMTLRCCGGVQPHPDGLRYSWFCQSYRLWSGKLNLVMRQEHRAGEKLFVDYAGQTVPVTERATGEIRQAQIFVAVLGASNYTYAEASWTQTLADWIGAHVRAFRVPRWSTVMVPDNLKVRWRAPAATTRI